MKALLIVFIALGFASAGLSQNTNDYPKTVWANVGYASPDAALETWTWALSKGDKKVMLQSLTPEAQKEWQEELAGMTDEQIKAKSAKGAAKQSGYTIRQREVVSGEEVILHISMIGSDEIGKMDIKKMGNEWKIAGPKED